MFYTIKDLNIFNRQLIKADIDIDFLQFLENKPSSGSRSMGVVTDQDSDFVKMLEQTANLLSSWLLAQNR